MAQSTSTSGRIFENALRALANDIVWNNRYLGDMSEKASYVDTIVTDTYTSGAKYLLMFYSQALLEEVEDYTVEEYIDFLNNRVSDIGHIRYWDMFFYGVDLSPNIGRTGSGATMTERLSTPKYEEKNKYYRMLFGMPEYGRDNLGDVISYPVNPKDLENTEYKPLYEFPMTTRYKAEKSGYLADVIEMVKNDRAYDYIQYLTNKRVHPFVARLAGRFELLYVPETDVPNMAIDFRTIYDECTTFMIYHYYSDAYRNQYEEYEGFIAINILFMTLQRMHSKYLEADITRDFYDLDSIKVVYDAYSVPFHDSIPISYHNKIIKAINRLISYKGSDKVFKELFELFGYTTLNIYQYYIHKQHKLDAKGNPLFVKDSNGNYDNRAMFDIKFVKGDIGQNPYQFIVDKNNDIDYWGVTSADPYWLNDKPLLDKLYDSDYNFIETKYIGIEMTFSLTRFLLESSYFIRMLLDNRNHVDHLTVSHGKLGIDIDIFTLVIYIHAIICRQLGVNGDLASIFQDPTKLAAIYGYNFIEDLQCVYPYISRSYIYNNSFDDMDDMSAESIANIRKLIISKTREEQEFEDMINGREITMSYTDEVCSYCYTKRKYPYITYCSNPDCPCHQADVKSLPYDPATGIAGNIYTVYTSHIIYDNVPVNLYKTLFGDDYKDIIEGISKYINRYTDKLPYSERTIDPDAKYINWKQMYTFSEKSDYEYFNILRAKKAIKDYVTGVIDEIDDSIPMTYQTYISDMYTARTAIEDKFSDPDDYTFDMIIRDYFLNNSYIKTNIWGYADGMVSGKDSQIHVESTAHKIIVEKILKIINTDNKLAHLAKGETADLTDINDSYHSIKELQEVFTELIWRVKDPKAYGAVKRIEKMLLTTRYCEDIYKKHDGTVATTYMDLLEDLNSVLALRIQAMDEKQLLSELDYSLACLQKLADNLVYIQNYGYSGSNRIVDYIYSLIRFFKSSKAELIDFNTEYTVDGKTTNLLKFMATLDRLSSTRGVTPDEWYLYDYIRAVIRELETDSEFKLSDFAALIDRSFIKRTALFLEGGFAKISKTSSTFTPEYCTLFDYFVKRRADHHIRTNIGFKDVLIKMK